MNLKPFLWLFLFLPFGKIAGQNPLERADIAVYKDGKLLEMAFAGGMNNPQFSEADLDNDGRTDLFVFDRAGASKTAFRRTGPIGSSQFEYAPELVSEFPAFRNWGLLRDYNCDQVPDLFCYSQTPGIPGVTVYKGAFTNENKLIFEQLVFPEYTFDILWFPTQSGFQSNLYVRNIDVPAIDDIDGDGDMDILSFGVVDGYLEYYENQSMDLGFGCDTLIMRLVDDCWGRFAENSSESTVLLSPDPDSCINRANFIGKSGLHIGSTVLTLDVDQDDDQDIFLGDSGSEFINHLINTRNADTAHLTIQDPNFPSGDVGLTAYEFLASFAVDIDEDGLEDLLFAPNQLNTSQDIECSFLYNNIGTSNLFEFSYSQSEFLVSDMIDEGGFSQPAVFDVNQDGLLDIILGIQRWEAQETVMGRIVIFENYGSPTEPKFRFYNTDDWLGYTNTGNIYPYLTFGDLDGDNDQDLIIGNQDGRLMYYENISTTNGDVQFESPLLDYQMIDVGQYSTPSLFDLNDDGLLDLIIGERTGNINYYENTGSSSSPTFSLVNDFLGEMDTRTPQNPTGYSQAIFKEENGEWFCYSGSDAGQVFKYRVNTDSLNEGSFELVTEQYENLREGGRSKMLWANLNQSDQSELLIGNRRGGLGIFSTEPLVTTNIENPEHEQNLGIDLLPNLGNGIISVQISGYQKPDQWFIEVFNTSGQVLKTYNWQIGSELDLSNLASGMYFLNFRSIDETSAVNRIKKYIKTD